jgi:hypothetical protein
MLFSLEDVQGEDEQAEVSWNGKKLPIRYNRNALSHEEYRRLNRLRLAAEGAQETPDWLVPMLLKLLTGWELLADAKAKKPLPITAESLNGLLTFFLLRVLNTIYEAAVPGPPSSTDSGSSF